jgi:hypothetical protein
MKVKKGEEDGGAFWRWSRIGCILYMKKKHVHSPHVDGGA